MINKQKSPFSAAEYNTRLARLRSAMRDHGANVTLVVDAGNICYLTGFGAASSYVAQALIVDSSDDHPTLVVRKQDAPAAMHMAFMPNDHVIGYPERFVGDNDVDGFDFMIDWIRERGDLGTLALEFDAMSGARLDRMRRDLQATRLVDMSGVVMQHRLVKSPAELAVMRQSATMTDLAMLRAAEVIAPGVRQCDAAAEITALLIRGTDDFGGDRGDAINMSAGQLTGTSHLNWSDEPFEPGTHVNIELGAYRHRYATGLMRSFSISAPSEKLHRLYDYMIEGCNAALAAARAGATTGDVTNAYLKVISKGGYDKESRCGYPIGIDWLETSCSLRADDPTVLEPGMVFHLMLGMWDEGDFGAVISETFVVGDGDCEVLSKVPRELFVIP